MNAIIDVFRMTELSPLTRANVIVKLGDAINNQYGMNITEPLVYELVAQIYPDHERLKDKYFRKSAGVE
jgi:hypothetical protein